MPKLVPDVEMLPAARLDVQQESGRQQLHVGRTTGATEWPGSAFAEGRDECQQREAHERDNSPPRRVAFSMTMKMKMTMTITMTRAKNHRAAGFEA